MAKWSDEIAAGGTVLGGIEGNNAAQKGFADAKKSQQDYIDLIRAINPEAASSISQDPNVRNAQLEALRQLQDVATSGGMDTASQVAERQAMDTANANARSQRNAVTAGMAQRGTGGGGAELAAKMIGQQGASNQAANAGAQAASDSRLRALQAMQAAGSQAGNVAGTDLGYQNAQNSINEFNAAQRLNQGRATEPGYTNMANLAAAQGQAAQKSDAGIGAGLGGLAGGVASIFGLADGGEVPEEKPSMLDALKRWIRSKPHDEEASRGVADAANSKLPEGLSARSAVKEHGRRLDAAYAVADDYADGGEVVDAILGKKKDAELPEAEDLPVYRGENAKKEKKPKKPDGEDGKKMLAVADEYAEGGEVGSLGKKRDAEIPEENLPVYRGESAKKEQADQEKREKLHAAIEAALAVQDKARGGAIDGRRGGHVPGVAKHPGNDPRNDVVPALLSPGEAVINRETMAAPDAPRKAANQVAKIKALRRMQGRE